MGHSHRLSKKQQLTELFCERDARDALQKVRSWDPEHWRCRAEEARTAADQMIHDEAQTIMRRIAMDYDRLAKLAEVQLFRWWHGI